MDIFQFRPWGWPLFSKAIWGQMIPRVLVKIQPVLPGSPDAIYVRWIQRKFSNIIGRWLETTTGTLLSTSFYYSWHLRIAGYRVGPGKGDRAIAVLPQVAYGTESGL